MTSSETPLPPSETENRKNWYAMAGMALVLLVFYVGLHHFGPGKGETAIQTWYRAWNKESDFEHGFIFPFLLPGLLIWRRKEILGARGLGEWQGILPVLFGCFLFALAYRTIQWRVAIVALPFFLTGSVWYLWGRKAALQVVFPFCLIWLAIPVGFLQQATGGLQLLATKLAHFGSTLAGVETTVMGNNLTLANGAAFQVDEGCSGIRSLWALMLIAAAWAYVAQMTLWKKALLFLCAFPLAILGNALRLISIFVIARYGDAQFAANSWHDWSPLVLFYPFSLFLLLAVHSILEGGLPWSKRSSREVRRVIVTRTATPDPHLP